MNARLLKEGGKQLSQAGTKKLFSFFINYFSHSSNTISFVVQCDRERKRTREKDLNICDEKCIMGMSDMAYTYLLNTLIVPIRDERAKFEVRKIDSNQAKEILKDAQNILSAIGHKASAEALTLILGIDVPANRVEVYFAPGDQAVALVLKRRLAEGQVLKTIAEIEAVGFDLYYIKRVE